MSACTDSLEFSKSNFCWRCVRFLISSLKWFLLLSSSHQWFQLIIFPTMTAAPCWPFCSAVSVEARPSCPCLKFFNFWSFSLNNNEVFFVFFLQLTGLKQHPQETRLCFNPLLHPVCDKSLFLLLHQPDLLVYYTCTNVIRTCGVDISCWPAWSLCLKPVSSLQTFLFLSTVWPHLNEGPFSFRVRGFQTWLFHNILQHHCSSVPSSLLVYFYLNNIVLCLWRAA